MNKIQSAFAYLLNLLDGLYGTGFQLDEAFEDAAIEFSLTDDEIRQLRAIHQGFINNF